MTTSEPGRGNLGHGAANMWPVREASDLGAALRDFRLARGITQAELAELVGIDRQYVSELETGKATEQLRRLVAAFRVLGITLYVGRLGP